MFESHIVIDPLMWPSSNQLLSDEELEEAIINSVKTLLNMVSGQKLFKKFV